MIGLKPQGTIMSFRITGLDPSPFRKYFGASDEELAFVNAKRCIADEKPGFPCRVTLEDAEPGEALILLTHTHQPSSSPYRASGPIFVRERAKERKAIADEIPAQLAIRLLSLRAYDEADMIVDADVVEGREAKDAIERFFANPSVAYIHAHFARRGCYAARIDRE